jgi:diguanylate cyclase (GGDEF)-like protein/PAS domain S-box-containing protein
MQGARNPRPAPRAPNARRPASWRARRRRRSSRKKKHNASKGKIKKAKKKLKKKAAAAKRAGLQDLELPDDLAGGCPTLARDLLPRRGIQDPRRACRLTGDLEFPGTRRMMPASSQQSELVDETPASVEIRRRSIVAGLRDSFPRGQTLPPEEWDRRHRVMLWILWAHVVALPVFSVLAGLDPSTAIASVVPIALAGAIATLKGPGRRARSVAVAIGLLTSSAVLVNAWGGQIEAHFHFFVMIALLALYEDWLPFGIAIGYVVAEHGVLGAISPTSVYDHGGNPWGWAAIHGGFVLAAATANVATWRLNEEMRVRMDEAHRHSGETSKRFQLAFESGVSGMALVSSDGSFIQVNNALCEITGYSEDELLATSFQAITHPDDLAADVIHLKSLVAGRIELYEREKRYIHRDGHEVWIRLGVTAVRGENGAVDYLIAQTHDISSRKQFESELAHRSMHDPLTDLPNRALLFDRLGHALARLRRQPGEIAVLFIDLDRFKLVNDGMGHGVGDTVLVDVSARLSAAARGGDTVARLGGDEFTILCEDAGEAEARLVARRVLEAFVRPFSYGGNDFYLSASVGIRVSDAGSADPDSLIRDADAALYSAKQRGRGRFEMFDPEAAKLASDPFATEQALRHALERDELRLHYQPEVDLSSGEIVALEALVRWEHPTRGLVPPGEFITLAEESGIIVPIGEWVLREACSQLVAWQADGTAKPDIRVAVNVSARQLSLPELPGSVASVLASTKLDPTCLCLEITETAIIEDPEVALTNLEALKAQGVSIALDDFGVGFSSLSQIRELPPLDVLKIDRSFIAGLGQNASDGAVINAVLGMADHLGLTVVAEGIETKDQLELLNGLHCAVGQGFYLARPQPSLEAGRLLSEGTTVPPGHKQALV